MFSSICFSVVCLFLCSVKCRKPKCIQLAAICSLFSSVYVFFSLAFFWLLLCCLLSRVWLVNGVRYARLFRALYPTQAFNFACVSIEIFFVSIFCNDSDCCDFLFISLCFNVCCFGCANFVIFVLHTTYNREWHKCIGKQKMNDRQKR